MRLYFGDLYITEVSREGLELSYEFECGHCESSEYLLDLLISHYNDLNLKFINLYYDALIDNYLVNLKSVNDKLFNEKLDLSLFSNSELEIIERDLKILF